MQIQKIIEQLGFSAKEAKVYLVALSLGECYVSDIALKLKLPITSVQVILDRLQRAGLMSFYIMRRYKYWVAESPEKLLYSLEQRETLIKEALPLLSALKRSGKNHNSHKNTHSLELFKMFADSVEQPVLILNAEVEIEYVNEAWEKLFGYVLEEVWGKNPKLLQSGKTPDEIYTKMWKALNAEKMFQTDEIVDKRKDGTLFTIQTTIFPVRHEESFFFIQILDETH